MKVSETDYALTTFQHWEYSLVKVALGCVTDRLFLSYSRQYRSRQQRQQERHSQSYKLSRLRSSILRHSHVADLDSSLHLSLHQLAAFIDPGSRLRPYHDVDAVSYLASLTCNDKARFIFNIFPKKLIPAGVEDLGFHIKVRAVQGHSSLPRNYDPSALGELLDVKACSDMGYIFHASSNVNYDSIDAHGLVLSPYSHGIGHEEGRVGVHFVYAGGVTQPRHGTVIRRGRDIHYWTDEIDGVLKTRDENAKEFTRFLSSVNMVTCNPWYLWEKGFTKLWIQGRDGSRVEARGDYDEPRVHLMEYSSLPDGIRNRLDVADKLEWLCHPLSGYLMKVFLDAFELGRVWGSIVLERVIKPNAGYYYAHGYGLSSRVPDQHHIPRVHDAAYRFWGPETTLTPEALARGSPPAIPKLQPHEEGYLEAQAKCQEKLREYAAISEKFFEGIYIKEDFDLLLEKCHELFSRDLFSHISKHRDDESERRTLGQQGRLSMTLLMPSSLIRS